ncbi:MAG: recombinase family protein [Oscillospiraceae bacterium]
MRFAIYCRKSKFTGRGESIENQLDYCRKYIDFYFNQSNNEISTYFDEGYSGKNFERPSFQQMLQDCQSNKFDFVVVYRLDRISRNVADFSNLYQKLMDLNIGFISASEKYDTSTSGGRAMLFMACVFAQLERETVSERVRDNMYSLAKTGRWLGGNTPTGFTSIKSTQDNKVYFRLKPNQDILIVRLIFRKYLESLSLTTLEKYLYDFKIKSPNDNYYSKSSLKSILGSPVYCQSDSVSYEYLQSLGCNMFCTPKDCNGNGYISYGRTSVINDKSQKRMSPSHWIVSIGEHSGIVSGKDWVLIQKSLHRGDNQSETIHSLESLLSGMILCPICNSKMITRTKSKGFVYSCSLKLQHGTKACKSDNIDGSIDSMLIDSIFNLVNPNVDIIPQLELLKKDTHTSNMDIQRDILSRRASKYRKLILNLDTSSLLFRDISKEYEEILKTLDVLEDTSSLDISSFDIKNILKEGYNALPMNKKRTFLKELICHIDLEF